MQSLVRDEMDGITELRLDRPRRANAVDADLLEGLLEAFDSDLGPVALLTAAGGGAFCGGADTKVSDDERAVLSDRLYALYDAMIVSPTVLICVLEGIAVGAGAQIAVACDVRIASPAAALRFAGPGHGLAVGTWALPSLVGRGRSIELCTTMRDVGAEEAAAIGLVERVVDDPVAEGRALAAHVARLDASARAHVKRLVGEAVALREALAAERRANRSWQGSLATSVATTPSSTDGEVAR